VAIPENIAPRRTTGVISDQKASRNAAQNCPVSGQPLDLSPPEKVGEHDHQHDSRKHTRYDAPEEQQTDGTLAMLPKITMLMLGGMIGPMVDAEMITPALMSSGYLLSRIALRPDLPDAREVRDRRSGHARKDHRGDDVRMAEPSRNTPDARESEVEDTACHAAAIHQLSRQHKKRDRDQRQIAQLPDELLRQHQQVRVGHQKVSKSGQPDRKGHGDADEHRQQQYDRRYDHWILPAGPASMRFSAINDSMKMKR
jgi:hypothetical protein